MELGKTIFSYVVSFAVRSQIHAVARQSLPRVLNFSVLLAVVGLLTASSKAGIILDGTGGFDEGYDIGFDIAFKLDTGSVIGGGSLFFATQAASDGSTKISQFMAYTMPKGIDNTYGINSANYEVFPKLKDHKFSDLLGSDKLGKIDLDKTTGAPKAKHNPFALSFDGNNDPASATYDVELQVDYIAKVSDGPKDKENPPAVIDYRTGGITPKGQIGSTGEYLDKSEGKSVGATPNFNLMTTLDHNLHLSVDGNPIVADFANLNSGGVGGPLNVLADSPEILLDAEGNPELDANGDYQVVDSKYSDWIWEIGYEFKFTDSPFGDDWSTINAFIGGGDGFLRFLDLGDAHVSPFNKNFGGKFASVVITPKDLPSPSPLLVPESATALLLVLGLGAMFGFNNKRRKN